MDANAPAEAHRECVRRDGDHALDARTVRRYFQRGLQLPTEPGSNGWLGFEGLSNSGLVTHVDSVYAGIMQYHATIAAAAAEQREETIVRARGRRWTDTSSPSPSPVVAETIVDEPAPAAQPAFDLKL